RPNDALFAGALPTAVRNEILVRRGFGANEAALEVGVDDAGRRGRGVTAVDCPRAHFLFTGGEIGLQSEQVIAGPNEAIEAGGLEPERLQEAGSIRRREPGEPGFALRPKKRQL